jgi:hypothetical protein
VAQNTQTTAAGGALTQQQVADLLLQPLQAVGLPRSRPPDLRHQRRQQPPDPQARLVYRRDVGRRSATIPDDDTTFGEITLLPKTMQAVKVITKVSDELLRQSIVALDQVLKDRLVTDIAASLDNAFINGTGTTQPLGKLAAQAGHRVRYVLAAKLVNELVEAADDRQLSRTIARYGRVELLCLDELGYMELDKRGAELLFQVLTERDEKTAVAIANNDSFSGWTKTFTDPRLCAADRGPPHLRRQHHRDRDKQLPPRPRTPRPTAVRWGHFKPSPRGQAGLTQPGFQT